MSTIVNNSIPAQYTTSPDRPFEPIGVRDQYLALQDVPNKNLTDAEAAKIALSDPILQAQKGNGDAQKRLADMNKEANTAETSKFEEHKIYNLSVKEIGYRVSDSVHDILDDLLHFDKTDGARGFLEVFVKEDRMIYVGIILMIFTIAGLLIRSV